MGWTWIENMQARIEMVARIYKIQKQIFRSNPEPGYHRGMLEKIEM